ncbi:MAG: hypothetical protein J2O48_02305 [Solirubrobacterales bacterium]|nr:hypothetical protein [Solirubrobacterales bacterium]
MKTLLRHGRWVAPTLALGVILLCTLGHQSPSGRPADAVLDSRAAGGHPAGPRALVAHAGNLQVRLTWAIPAGTRGIAGYNIYRNGVRVKTGVIGHSFTDQPLTNGRTYTYTVKAYWRKTGGASTTLSEPAKPVRATPSHPVYWGAAWIGSQFTGTTAPDDWNAVTDFERRDAGGHRLSVLGFGDPWRHQKSYCTGQMSVGGDDNYCPFPAAALQKVRSNGVIPVYTWTSQDAGVNNPAFTDAAIAHGSQDAYLTQWAKAAKSWGHPFFLRLDQEFNGTWFPFGVNYSFTGSDGVKHTNTPQDFLSMWKHVVNVFRHIGANNVTWVWCPNIEPMSNGGNASTWVRGVARSLKAMYARGYVDWTCLDGYNRGKRNWNGRWSTFSQTYGDTYQAIESFAPDKPMMLGEIGSTGTGGNKSAWVSDFLKELPHFAAVRAFTWFETPDWNNDPIDGKAPAQRAFAGGVNNNQFVQNLYGNLSGGVIAPPKN